MQQQPIVASVDPAGCINFKATQTERRATPENRRRRAIKKLVFRDGLTWDEAAQIVACELGDEP